MKRLICSLIFALAASSLLQSQTVSLNTLIESRIDANFATGGNSLNIKHINASVKADLIDRFEFYWRVRGVRWAGGENVLDASDFLYLGWKPADFLILRAGKGCLYIGGYEYEQNPMNYYFLSDFCANVAAYQYMFCADILTKNDILGLQLAKTPFDSEGLLYSAMWTGNHKFFQSIWSVNYADNRGGAEKQWLLSLGNKFLIRDKLSLYLDWTDRLIGGAFNDFTIVPRVEYTPFSWLRTRLEGSYDCLHNGTVLNGGIHFEFFPYKSMGDKFRLHLVYNHRYSKWSQPETPLIEQLDCLNIGLSYKLGAEYRSKK